MKRIKVITVTIAAVLALYIGSYLAMTLGGHYEPSILGFTRGPGGTNFLTPRGTLGYVWWPFSGRTRKNMSLLRATAYSPMIALDRKFWHTSDKMETFRYGAKDYFDFKTWKYRDIEPK